MMPHEIPINHEEDITMHTSPERLEAPSTSSRPNPRPPRSQAEVTRIRVKNRRREYLERNPAYFKSAEHEFADPLLYDELVRQFQTPAEREEEGRTKGYGRVLEGSLLRGEARLAQLTKTTTNGQGVHDSSSLSQDSPSLNPEVDAPPQAVTLLEADIATMSTPPANREEATERWQEFLSNRFIRGGDEEFEYRKVDENEEYDTLARKEEEEAWFEDEDPDWASTGEDEDEEGENKHKAPSPEHTRPERILQGQTGIQDY